MKPAIVVGSGIAGLIAALELSRGFEVTLVTKARLTESNTRYAQGGIAAAMWSDDSAAEHIQDTLRAGAGLCQLEAIETLCNEGLRRIRELIALGVEFDRHDGDLARGLEAAHSRARVLHAGGDATGLNIEQALVEAVRCSPCIRVREHTFAVDLELQHGVVSGLEVLSSNGEREVLGADIVLLASGGAGQLFQHTTNPAVATGDGVAIAWRAGAELADLEFYQFHPTALALPGAAFLISEAVRGEGAVLRDREGRRFMRDLDPRAELAPRDVVARGIALQMSLQDGAPVLLDATHLGAAKLKQRFPTIDAAVRSRGLDWSQELVPITPAAHYWMGGVCTDSWGRTSVPGLYAAGEVACTGVHGANRLASNSLLESLVFAWRCSDRLLSAGAKAETLSDGFAEKAYESVGLLAEERSSDAATIVSREAVQELMWKAAGIQRDGDGLSQALAQVERWQASGGDVAGLETRNLLLLSRLLMTAALRREESRGAHSRADFPETSAGFQRSLIFKQKTQSVAPHVVVSCS